MGHFYPNLLICLEADLLSVGHPALDFIDFFSEMVGDPGIEPGVRLREGVTVPCHTLRPVAHFKLRRLPRFGHEYDLENRASTRKLPLTE